MILKIETIKLIELDISATNWHVQQIEVTNKYGTHTRRINKKSESPLINLVFRAKVKVTAKEWKFETGDIYTCDNGNLFAAINENEIVNIHTPVYKFKIPTQLVLISSINNDRSSKNFVKAK